LHQRSFGYDVHIPMGRAHSTCKVRLEPLFSFPKLHNISFHHLLWKVSNCWLTKDLHFSYVIDVFFYFFFYYYISKKNYFCTMKNSEHNRHNCLSTLYTLQTIANLALTTSLINVALRNAFVGNFDNICQKGFFGAIVINVITWLSIYHNIVHLDTNTTLCHVKIQST